MESSSETKEMILDIVAEISYDIWKESYNLGCKHYLNKQLILNNFLIHIN